MAKLISTPTSSEVVVFSAVYIRGSVEDYLKASRNFNSLRSVSDGCIRKEYDSNNGCLMKADPGAIAIAMRPAS